MAIIKTRKRKYIMIIILYGIFNFSGNVTKWSKKAVTLPLRILVTLLFDVFGGIGNVT